MLSAAKSILLGIAVLCLATLSRASKPPSEGDPWCPAEDPFVLACTTKSCRTWFEPPILSQKGNCEAHTDCAWQYVLKVSTPCDSRIRSVRFRGDSQNINPPDEVTFTGSIGSPCATSQNPPVRFYDANGNPIGSCLAMFHCAQCPDPPEQ